MNSIIIKMNIHVNKFVKWNFQKKSPDLHFWTSELFIQKLLDSKIYWKNKKSNKWSLNNQMETKYLKFCNLENSIWC